MDSEVSDMEGLEGDEQTDLKQQLDTAMATIIKLRATPNQITETEIKDDFESLQRAIQNWVRMIDKELKGSHNDYGHMFRKAFVPQDEDYEDDEDNKRLRWALKQFGTMDNSDDGQSRMWMLWLGRLNTCMDVVFCRGIWTCLEKCIFSMRYPVGVDPDTEDTFTSIIEAMHGEDGDEDERSRANQWKSETLNAYIRTEKFQDEHEKAKSEIFRKLDDAIITMLKNNLPKRNRHIGALETNVFEPALSLHQRMACSSFTYQLATPKLRRGERRVDTKIVSWKLQDMVKWRPINMEDIGGIFQCLYPAVFRVGKTRKEDVFVCEATILAYDLGEGPKTPRGPLMASLTPLHESPRESPQQSPRGSPDRHYRGIRKAYTDEVHRDIITVIPDEGGHSRNWRRHNTAPVPSPTTNAVKPKHRGKFLDRFRTPLEPSNPETAFDDDPSKSRTITSAADLMTSDAGRTID
ncbi:hypothetical protein E8E14_012086 [Neopestalotiopsis sp. 37M]|nr:hypothetical protein E8E14_012086 [Neopestalotiopsis sp. 37M]